MVNWVSFCRIETLCRPLHLFIYM